MAGNVPVFESIGAAFRYTRENVAFIATVSAAGAGAMAVLGVVNVLAPALGFVAGVVSMFVQAFVYAAFVGAALVGASAVRPRWLNDGMRVWAALAIIAFLLFIVMFVAFMVACVVLAVGPLAPYVPDLSQAGSDEAAVMAVMTRFAEENPLPLLLLAIFLGAIWMLITSRLYLAAPASVDAQRLLTFETWSWTKGAMLNITGARLLLLVPANIFVGAVAHIFGRLVGINSLDPNSTVAAASGNPAGYIFFVAVSAFLSIGLYSALEAGLSSYLYRGLKPADAAPAPSQGSTDS